MSKKTNTATAPAETGAPAPEHHVQSGPVPVLRSDSTRALWAALYANPGRTTAALANIAGIGQSTARRLLAQWETAGCARSHTDCDSPTAPKIWNAGVGAPATTESDTAPVPADPAPAEPATPEPVNPEPVSARVVTSAETDPVSPAIEPEPEVASPGSDTPADPELDTTAETSLAAPTGDEPATGAPVSPAAADDGAAADAESTVERLPAGALRGQVEDFLHENPGKEFTPHQIGKALARSSGAVHNALVKLTDGGNARQTSTAPKKFTLAS